MRWFVIVGWAALFGLPTVGVAAVVHDESVAGDLPSAFDAPLLLGFAPGANTVIGKTGATGDGGVIFGPDGNDADRFAFVVPAGQQISAITVDAFSGAASPIEQSFLAYVVAPVFASDIDNERNVLFDADSGDLLPALADGPLGPGPYAFWIQETSLEVIDYQITFVQTPEPTSFVLLAIASLAMVGRQRVTR